MSAFWKCDLENKLILAWWSRDAGGWKQVDLPDGDILAWLNSEWSYGATRGKTYAEHGGRAWSREGDGVWTETWPCGRVKRDMSFRGFTSMWYPICKTDAGYEFDLEALVESERARVLEHVWGGEPRFDVSERYSKIVGAARKAVATLPEGWALEPCSVECRGTLFHVTFNLVVALEGEVVWSGTFLGVDRYLPRPTGYEYRDTVWSYKGVETHWTDQDLVRGARSCMSSLVMRDWEALCDERKTLEKKMRALDTLVPMVESARRASR